MNSYSAFALFFFSAIALGAAIPAVPMQCPENEIFKPCGSACAPTCNNPHPGPACTRQCVIGCFCNEGYLRNSNGMCVQAHECEKSVDQKTMAIVLPPEMQCKSNEMYMPCGSACAPTCKNPHPSPMCTKQCVPGCFCQSGFLKNEEGICVRADKCDVEKPVCMDDNEEYLQCKGCDGTCENPDPMCPRICVSGCACKKDHVRDGNGRCMPIKKCAIRQRLQPERSGIVAPMCIGQNEVFQSCRRCDGTCEKPNPICPRSPRICRPGCMCKEGHVRDADGVCVALTECSAPKVSSIVMPPPVQPKCPQNEIFRTCGTACPPTCADPHPSPVCTRQCVVSCFCQEGFLRNAKGVCVQAANCEA